MNMFISTVWKKKVIFDKLFIYSSTNRFMLSYSYSCIVYVLLLSVKKKNWIIIIFKKIYFDVEMEVHYINISFPGTTKNKWRKYKNRFIQRKCYKQIKWLKDLLNFLLVMNTCKIFVQNFLDAKNCKICAVLLSIYYFFRPFPCTNH